jgi:endonuclease/exonuclease/phosphatase family metal-dependent hydrolase
VTVQPTKILCMADLYRVSSHGFEFRVFLTLLAVGCRALGSGNAEPVRVLVYNIHAGTDAARVPNLERVAEVVRATRADIVLLQEVDRRTRRSGGVDQLDSLRRLTGLSGAFGKTIDYDNGEYGLGILSRWAIQSDSLVPLPVAAPHAGYEARGAMVARVEMPGRGLRIIDTHLDASRESYRTEQAGRLAAISAGPEQADMVGGDFNSEPGAGVLALLAAAGFRDAWPGCGEGPGLTFPVTTPTKRIDYLLISSRWKCISATVLSAQASDHRAVLFEIVRH